jgi:1-acyl-sn-glycerol-3-phosphate acyltransferase
MKLWFPSDGTWFWRLWYIVAILIEPIFCRVRRTGVENVPKHGGCIVASNHNRGPDIVVMGYAAPRQLYFMAKEELFRNKFIGKWIGALGAFPVKRGQRDSDAFERAVEVVQQGKVLGMYPEGTRSRDGKLQRGRSGVARIALAAKAPIVPAVVINSEAILRDVLKFQWRPIVTVQFGKPIYPQGDPDDAAAVRRLTNEMMLAVAELLPPERRGYYADRAAVEREQEADAQADAPAMAEGPAATKIPQEMLS